MRVSSLPRFSLARAAALAAALACPAATSFGGNLYTENFNSYSGTQNANQVTTGLPVAHTGTVTGWNRSGDGTIHAVRVATGDWAPMFYDGNNAAGNNIITTASTIASTNTANQTYRVAFLLAPGVYANSAQATGSTDGVVLSLLTGANATITSGTFLPGAFSGQASSGNLPFQNAAFDYVGTGSDSGALRLQFAANNAGAQRFGGSVDNVNIVTTALWNNGTSGNWSTAGNWRSGAIPVNSDLVLINGTSGGTSTNDISNLTIAGLEFMSGAGSFTVSGNDLTLSDGVTNAGNSSQTLATNLILGGTTRVFRTVGNLTVSGVISNGSGSPGLTKNGTGTLTLSGNNTYNGTTTLNAGTVVIGHANGLGTTGNITFSGGGLQYGSGITQDLSSRIKNSGSAILVDTNSNNVTFASAVDSTNSGGLTKNGTGTLTLTGNNTYSGNTTINAGTLEIGAAGRLGGGTYAGAITNNATLIYSGTNNQTLSGVISGTGALTKNGSGTLTLSGTNTYTGGTTVNAGTLSLAAADANGIIRGNLTINQGARVDANAANWSLGYGGTQNYFGNSVSAITINGGTLNFTNTSNDGGIVAATTVLTGGTISSAGTFAFLSTLTYNQTVQSLASASRSTIASGIGLRMNFSPSIGNLIFDVASGTTSDGIDLQVDGGIINATSQGGGNIVKSGSGKLLLAGNNTYTGTTTINAGTIEIGAAGRLGAGTYSQNITNNGTLVYSGTNAQTLSGVISGTGALTKNGSGTLTLSNAANTYNGSTTVNAGTLAVSGNISSSAITLSSGGVISAGSAAAVAKFNAASLTISGDSGYAFTIGNISGGAAGTAGTDYDQIATSGGITFNNTVSNPFTIYINGTPTNWSSSGSYTWNILSGSSISGFSAANFVADTACFGGSLASGASWTFGTSGGNLTLTYGTSGTPTWAGGTGVWSGNFTPSLSNNLDMFFTGAGGVATNDIASGTLSSVGTITFNSTAGSYTLAANSGSAGNGTALTLAGSIINNSASAQTINTALSFGATRTINTASGNITIGGAISGAGGLTKSGNSILSLGGNNTFAGATTISAGTLEVTSTGLLGGGNYSQDIANSGTFIFGSNSNQTLGGIISGSGALTKNGTGTLSLSGVNTYTGATTINAGTLEITSTGQLGSGTYSQNIGNNGTFVLGSNSNHTLSGIISGTGALTKNGAGTLTLSGNNTYTGATTINAGTVQITSTGLLGGGNYTGNIVNSGSLILSSSNAQILGGNISGSGAITKNGSGTLTLSGNNTYSGGTTISGGSVYVGSNSAFGAGNVTLNNISIGSSAAATISNNITLANTVTWGVGYVTSNLTLNGVVSGTGVLNLDTNQSFIITLNGLNTFTSNISAPRTGAGLYFNSIADAGVASALGAGSSISTGAGIYTPGLRYTGNVAASTNRTISMGGGGLVIRSDSAALTWTGNITAAGSIPLYLQGTAGGGANFNELSGAFLAGNNLVIQAGSGNDVWRISGNNTHTGLTQVTNTSTMIAANANAFGTTAGATQVDTSGQLLLTGGLAVGSEALTLNSNASGTWNGYTGAALRSISGNNSWAGNITLSQATTIATDSGAALTISGNITGANNLTINSTGNTTLSGIIGTSTGTLTKNGTGTLLLTANNTYTGATTVNAGTLEVSSTGLLGGGSYSGNIANTGTLLLGSNSNQTLSGVISGSGAITKNGTGTLTISNAASTHNGTFTIASGTLAASGNISSSVVLNTGARISAGTAAASAKFNAGTLTIGAGTGYDFTISSVSSSVAGTDYDQIALSGAATFNNTAASKFTIYLNGTPTGWSNTGVYSWDMISAASQAGFTAGNFTTDFTNFGIAEGNRTGTWTFTNPSLGIIQLTYAGQSGNSTWNTGTGSWNTAAQWAENTIPVNFNNLTFNGTGGTATNNIGNTTLTSVNNITFDSGAGAYTLNATAGSAGASGGTALSVTGNIVNNSSNLQTLSTDLSFGSTRTVNTASGNITISGNISGGGGNIKTGGNTLLLTGNNTYTGTTTINAGTLQVGGSNGNIAGAIVNNANLLYNSSAFGIYGVTGSGNLTINQSSGNVYLQGNITQSGTVNITTSAATTTSGMIQSALGTVNVNRMNTSITASAITINGMIGAFQDSSRILTLDTSASNGAITLDLQNGSSGTWNAVSIIANAGTGNITLSGTKANTTNNAPWLASTPNSFTGAINISSNFLAGTLNLNATGNSSVSGNLTLGANSTSTWNVASGLTMTTSGLVSGNNASLTKDGTGTLTLSANNTYNGTTTINGGTLQTTSTGLLGGGSYAANIANSGTFIIGANSNQTLSGVISGTGALTKNGTGTLALTGNNTYTGGTTLNAGTLAIGHAKGLGTGNFVQTSGGSFLVIDTTGTITNNMSVYNVRASQSATLGGAITVNNAVWDVDGGDTLTISGGVGGSGGVTKNGTGTLVLSGSNTYSGATMVNSGTLNANNANALGTNAAVTVNGGSLLVSADDAINGKNLTLASTATGNGTAASLVFSGSYNGTAGSLTLNQNSIIDLGTDPAGVVLRFSEIVNLATYSLSIYNWTGTTLWGGTDRNNKDQFYVTADITSNLGQISFYSGIDNSSFLGTGYQLSGSGFYNNQVIPVPEPETYATALLLLIGAGCWTVRRHRARKAMPAGAE